MSYMICTIKCNVDGDITDVDLCWRTVAPSASGGSL